MMKKMLMQRTTKGAKKELQKANGKGIKRKEKASKGAEEEKTRRQNANRKTGNAERK